MTADGRASKSAQILTLARELLDDIELSRLPTDSLLLKATRLARLVGDEIHQRWLALELRGYPNEPEAMGWALQLGRKLTAESTWGYYGPLAQVDALISVYKVRLQSLRIPDVSVALSSANPKEFVTGTLINPRPVPSPSDAIKNILEEAEKLSAGVSQLTQIRSRVISWLHIFVARVYHERAFSGLAESIFEQFKQRVDAVLLDRSSAVLSKVPSITDRLAEGDSEAVSQALTTCRRIIDDFADAIYPPAGAPVVIDGESLNLGPKETKNRIRAYLDQNTKSKSRKGKLKKTLQGLYERTSAAVHHEAGPHEARALFLETYIFMGEVLELASPPTGLVVLPGPSSKPLSSEPLSPDLAPAPGTPATGISTGLLDDRA